MYQKMIPYIEENYETALKYVNWQERLKNKIEELSIQQLNQTI